MPSPIGNAIRVGIVQRHETGETLRSISEEMNLSYETVKHIWQHWVKTGKVEPNYARARARGTRRYAHLYPTALALKSAHPRWGAQLIVLELQKTTASQHYPSVRTLQRWFREAGISRTAGVKQRHEQHVKRGQVVHQVWAVDAKEQMQLADGSGASWLVVSDEASGAILHTAVFPPQALDTGEGQSRAGQSENSF